MDRMADIGGLGARAERTGRGTTSIHGAKLGSNVHTTIKCGLDLAAMTTAVIAAYVLRFEQIPGDEFALQLLGMLAVLPLVRLGFGRWVGTHRASWRLFGLAEGKVLARAVAGPTALLVAARLVMPWLLPEVQVIPLGVIALEGALSLVLLLGLRVAVRTLDEQQARRAAPPARRSLRALLVGAGRAGRMAAHELQAHPDVGFAPVGFLDDDSTRVGKVVDGVPVLGSTARAAELARTVGAQVIILTMPSVPSPKTRAVVARCSAAELPIRTVPGLYELLGEKVGITRVRPLKLEDLLGRGVVGFDEIASRRVRRAFSGRRILVTGAGGSIGSELCRQLAALGPALLVLVENHENHLFDIEQELLPKLGKRVIPCLTDVRVVEDVEAVFAEHRPEIVFHAAAYKHVPMMEKHPAKAVLNNVRGTRVVAETARKFGAERFLLVSTDKAVNPTSVMGATKRAAEMLVLGIDGGSTRYCAVRFGNVLGSAGSVLHTFTRQLEAGGPITLTHPEITRYFMTIPEAVRLVLQANTIGKGGDLFVLDMGEPVKIIDLARQLIRHNGLDEQKIGITVVGLRPGEKLYEELLGEHECKQASGVTSIWVSRSAASQMSDVNGWIRRLEQAAEGADVEQTRQLLGEGTGYCMPQAREISERFARVAGHSERRAARS
jgi:FlaA1/EpsC-like NDP-sugar epimerase